MQALGNVLPQVRRVFPLLRNALPRVGGVFPLLRNVLPQVRSVFAPLRNTLSHVRYAPANWADDSAHATINSHIAAFNCRVAQNSNRKVTTGSVMPMMISENAEQKGQYKCIVTPPLLERLMAGTPNTLISNDNDKNQTS